MLHDASLRDKHVHALRAAGAVPVLVPRIPSALQYTPADEVVILKTWLLNLDYDVVVFLDGDAFADGYGEGCGGPCNPDHQRGGGQ